MKTPNTMKVLVLSGIVTLTNQFSTFAGEANDLLVATPDSAPVKKTVKANGDFACDLYHQLAKENKGKNLFFSPYSISGALAMTAEGARGKTATEMGEVLRFPDSTRRTGDDAQRIPWETSQIHTGFGEINARLNEKLSEVEREKIESQVATLQTELKEMQEKASKKWGRKLYAEIEKIEARIRMLYGKMNPPKLAVANALWGEKTFPFRDEYVDTISTSYKTGGLFSIDFAGKPEPSRLHINSWVEEQTNSRIKNLIPKGDIDESTKLVLTNAIYFKGNWATQFDKNMTRTRDFTRDDGSKVKTPIMFGILPIKLCGQKIAEDTHISVAELPYLGDELSMVLINAGGGKSLSTVEKHLTSQNLDKWLATLKKGHRDIHHVSLPRFKMESKYKLNNTLKAMGMATAFKKGAADFTGLSESHGKKLYISFVHHKGFIDVNEEGTEATAATSMAACDMSLPPIFDGTRPFIYLIRDNVTGSILFMGRMMDPAATDDGPKAEVKVPAENVAVPKYMSLAGDMIRGKVLSVGSSQSFCTEITYTTVRLSVLEVYRGKAVVGKPVELVISGWLESEKKEALLFEKAMKGDKEVVVIMEKSYQPYVKKAMPHSLGRMKPNYAYRLGGGYALPKDITPHIMEATAEVRKQAETAAKLPIGWTFDGKMVVSPWSAVKGRYAKETPQGLACAKSGRPAFLAPKGLSLTVDRAKNQDTNGKFQRAWRTPGVFYEISLINTTKAPITVEALRSRNGEILWDESILLINEWMPWLPIGFRGFTPSTEATVIQPAQKLTTTMYFSNSHDMHTLICLGNLNFRIYQSGTESSKTRGPIQKLRGGAKDLRPKVKEPDQE